MTPLQSIPSGTADDTAQLPRAEAYMAAEIDNAGVACRVQPTCENCGSYGTIVHRDLEDQLFGAAGRWGLRRCSARRCGFLWLDPMPLPTETYKFYARYYTHTTPAGNNSSTSVKRHESDARGRRAIKGLLSRVLFWRKYAFLSGLCHLEGLTPGRLLEIGCGNGRFLQQAREAGWRPIGIDFDGRAIEVARSVRGADAAIGDLHAQHFDGAMFDAIVMNNVIEHLPQPQKVFDECARVMRTGGRMVVITPNSRSLGYKLYAEDWRGLEIPRHLQIFSAPSLITMARKAHFARVSAFSSPGGETGLASILASEAIRNHRRKTCAPPNPRFARHVIARERIRALLGGDVGEFSVLVAHR